MSRQPIIIQVLSGRDSQTIRHWMITLGVITTTFLTIAMILATQYAQHSLNMLITGAIVLILFGNIILLVRNNLIDRHSKSLCLDGGNCYTVAKNGVTSDQPTVQLHYKKETLTIENNQEKELQHKNTLAFQVLNRQDWKAIKQLRAY